MILIPALGLPLLTIVALLYGSLKWKRETQVMQAKMEAGRESCCQNTYRLEDLEGLPRPVQAYFRTVLVEWQPIVLSAQVGLSGTINMGDSDDNWKRFESAQFINARRPGFDLDARIRMIPGINAWVRDAYIAGEGILNATLFGLFSLANLRGTTEMARGELMRFFAEAPWYPTALLPSQGVQWKEVDDRSATGTLKDGAIAITLLFRFAEEGHITSVHAVARGRTVGSAVIPTPWEGNWSNYKRHGGMCPHRV